MPDEPACIEPVEEMDTPTPARWVGRFWIVDTLLIASILTFAMLAPTRVGTLVSFLLQGVLFVVVAVVSGLPRSWLIAVGLAALVGTIALVIGLLSLSSDVVRTVVVGVMVATAVVSPAMILRRLVRHGDRVDASMVSGAVAIYLYVGMFFGMLYALIAAVSGHPALAAAARETVVSDHIYFSFVTLTTVGFGDVTGATEITRMLAVVEALIGQVYLVTVVALLVSRIGTKRGPRQRLVFDGSTDESREDDRQG